MSVTTTRFVSDSTGLEPVVSGTLEYFKLCTQQLGLHEAVSLYRSYVLRSENFFSEQFQNEHKKQLFFW